MKVKNVSELAFRVLDEVTDDEDELWVAHIIFDGQAKRTGDIQRIMKDSFFVSYDTVQRVLKTLVEKEIIHRASLGVYAPNLKMILDRMVEILEVNP